MAATQEKRIATLGTVAFCALLFMLLVVVTFVNNPTQEEEGVLINFGDSEQGMGQVEPAPAVAQNVPAPLQPTPTSVSQPEPQTGEEEVVNQDFEESAVIEQRKKEELKKKQEQEKELQRQLEQKRLEEEQRQAEEEQKRIEQQRQQQQENIQNMAKSAFAGRNTTGGTSGEGSTGTTGNQGALSGDVNSTNRAGNGGGNGINFSLAGRSFGTTPPKPEYNSKSEGKVVVEIWVDRNGNVISASPGKTGTTVSDQVLWNAAKTAALKAKFNSDPNAAERQQGTITYTFIQQ